MFQIIHNQKLLILAAIFFFSATKLPAQTIGLVHDKEKIFTDAETSRIDSLLQAYKQATGNLIAVCSDSLNINTEEYKAHLKAEFIPDPNFKPRTLLLLLSRKNSQVNMVAFNLPETNEWQHLMPIMDAGVGSFKAKKPAEGSLLICKKAMEYLDALPKK
jgi:hypothetical protein